MKVYVGRRKYDDFDGCYEFMVSKKPPKWDKAYGFNNIDNSYVFTSKEFHKHSNLRLRKGQMKTFDRMEFK